MADQPSNNPMLASAPPPAEAEQESLMSRLNPFNLLKRETPDRYIKEGMEMAEKRLYAQAALNIQKAIDLNPKYSPSYIAMADMLVKKGGTANLKEAIGFLSQASLNDPLNVNIYFSAAKIYSALNMRAEEMVEKKKVSVVKTLETDPHNSVANNNMGVLTLQQERVHEAMEYFKKALVQNPGYDVAYRNMSLVQLKLAGATTEKEKRTELLEKGITFIQKALSIHPKGLPNMLAYAKLLMSQDKYKEALDVLEAGEKIDSANREIFGLKKTIYIKMNMVEEAQNAAAIYETLSNHEAGR